MRPAPPDLLRESGAQLAPLLTQRLYAACAPPLRAALAADGAADGADDPVGTEARARVARRTALLEALAHTLVATPRASLVAEPAAAVPYLLEWLQATTCTLDEVAGGAAGGAAPTAPIAASAATLLHAVLDLLAEMLRLLPEAEAEPLGALVPTLLTLLAACERLPGVSARVDLMEACLLCLDAARGLPYHRLRPHKRRVLRVLGEVLDHRKRRVRQAACRCANRWHLLGGRTGPG